MPSANLPRSDARSPGAPHGSRIIRPGQRAALSRQDYAGDEASDMATIDYRRALLFLAALRLGPFAFLAAALLVLADPPRPRPTASSGRSWRR